MLSNLLYTGNGAMVKLSAEIWCYIVVIVARDGLEEEKQGWVAALCTTSRAMDAVARPLLVEKVVIASPRAWCALVDACRLDKDMLSAAGKNRFSRTHELMVTISDAQLGESLADLRLPRDAFCRGTRF